MAAPRAVERRRYSEPILDERERIPSMTGDDPVPRRPFLLGRATAVLVVVGALAVAAAVVGRPADRARGLPVDIPWPALVLGADALVGAVIAAGALLAVATVWALATAPRRRPPGARPWWHTPLALAVLALAILVLSWLTRRGMLAEPLERLAQFRELFGGAAGEPPPGADAPGAPTISEALRSGAVLAGALLVVAGALLLLRRRTHVAGEGEPAPGSGTATARLAEAVDAALEDLDAGADPRQAVLRCYRRLEAALAAAGCPRRRSETAREHRHRAAATLGDGARAAARLVDRFERARYDVAPVGEEDRRAAVAALQDVRAALAAAPGGHGREAPGRRVAGAGWRP